MHLVRRVQTDSSCTSVSPSVLLLHPPLAAIPIPSTASQHSVVSEQLEKKRNKQKERKNCKINKYCKFVYFGCFASLVGAVLVGECSW